MKTAIFHDQTYEYFSWQYMGELVLKLAEEIIKEDVKIDRIIALAKGGITFSRTLLDYLNVQALSSLEIEFYTGIGETARTPVINQSLPVTVRGENILIFDDIVDTGETLELATKYLQYHGAQKIYTASLFTKPWTKIRPDFSGQESKAWIIFPHESRETIGILSDLWTKKGDSPEKIKSQLLEIGFPESEVALFLGLK